MFFIDTLKNNSGAATENRGGDFQRGLKKKKKKSICMQNLR